MYNVYIISLPLRSGHVNSCFIFAAMFVYSDHRYILNPGTGTARFKLRYISLMRRW